MHNAPSVSYPVGRCAFQRTLYVFFTSVSSALLLVWAMMQPISVAWLVAAFASGLAIVLGGRAYLCDRGMLTWDGQAWCLHDQAGCLTDALGTLTVALDVQHALVLRWQPLSDERERSKRWLWVGAENSPVFWQDLRCAVFGRSNTL
jgi:toxin CptA